MNAEAEIREAAEIRAKIRAEIREQLLRGDTEIEYEFTFTATLSKDAQLNRKVWNIAVILDEDEYHQLGEVFWNDNGHVVFHADADEIHANVLQDIGDFMDTVEAVAKEQAKAKASPALMN